MKIILYLFIETHLRGPWSATGCLQLYGEWQKTTRRAHYVCQHFNEPREECGAASLLLCSCGKIWQAALKKWQAEAEGKVTWSLMEPSVRCETRNVIGQCAPTRTHQSRNSQTLITGSTESHRHLLYQTSLTEVKRQSPGAGKVVLSVSNLHTRHVERKWPWTHLSKPALLKHWQMQGFCSPGFRYNDQPRHCDCNTHCWHIHEPQATLTHSSLLPPRSEPSLDSNTCSLKCCTAAPILCYIWPWTSLSLLCEIKTMGLMAFLDVMYPTTSCQSSDNAPSKDLQQSTLWCKNKFQQCSLPPCYNGDKRDWPNDPLVLPSASQVLLPATHGEHSCCHHHWMSTCSLLWSETSSLHHNKGRIWTCK